MIWEYSVGPRLKTLFEVKDLGQHRDHTALPARYALVVADPGLRSRVKLSHVCREARDLLAPSRLFDVSSEDLQSGFAIWAWFDLALDSLLLPNVQTYKEELEVCSLIRGPVPRILLEGDWLMRKSPCDLPSSVPIRPFFNILGCSSIGFVGTRFTLPPEQQAKDLLWERLGSSVPLAFNVGKKDGNSALKDIFSQYRPSQSWTYTRRRYRDGFGWDFPLNTTWTRRNDASTGFKERLLFTVAYKLWLSQDHHGSEFPGWVFDDPWYQEQSCLRELPAFEPMVLLVDHKRKN